MRNTAILALAATGLALAACSERAQENAESTVDAIGEDVQGAIAGATTAADDSAKAVSEAADRGAAAIGGAADKAVQGAAGAAGDLGRKVQQKAAEVEARTQNGPTGETSAD